LGSAIGSASADLPEAAPVPTSTPPEHKSPVFVANAEDAEAELVGRFHYATLVRSHPRVPGTWLVTSSDTRVIGQVAELLGGTPPGSYDGGQTPYVITGTTEIDVLLTGPEALDVGWHRQPGHVCDGAVQHDQRGSRPCACPPNLADRKTVARAGHGCHPRTQACFRLLQGPALGTFTFSSGNQAFAKQASHALASLRRDPRPTCARLSLQRTPHRLRSGTTIAYTRPTLVLLGQAT
jgi:hypothetical protein